MSVSFCLFFPYTFIHVFHPQIVVGSGSNSITMSSPTSFSALLTASALTVTGKITYDDSQALDGSTNPRLLLGSSASSFTIRRPDVSSGNGLDLVLRAGSSTSGTPGSLTLGDATANSVVSVRSRDHLHLDSSGVVNVGASASSVVLSQASSPTTVQGEVCYT